MSFQAMAWAVKQKVGNATGKAILLMLANYADERGECFPSQETLAGECECSIATVARWIKHFEGSGFLTRSKQYGEGGYRRADRLRLRMNLPVTELPSAELPNSKSNLTRHSDGAEPITEPIISSSLRSDDRRTPRQELETVLDSEHASDVIEHRQRLRKPLTAKAAKLLARQLAQCPDPNAAADLMIERGWLAVKPDWVRNAQQPRGSPPRHQKPLRGSEHFFASAAQDIENEQRRNDQGQGGDWDDAHGFPVLTIEHRAADG